MYRKKLEIDDINALLTLLMPKIDSESKHQIQSLLSLVISILVMTVSFTSLGAATGNGGGGGNPTHSPCK
jgi:hypothetical protein